jgi:hypothetical protein
MTEEEASKLTVEDARRILHGFKMGCTSEDVQAFLNGNVRWTGNEHKLKLVKP